MFRKVAGDRRVKAAHIPTPGYTNQWGARCSCRSAECRAEQSQRDHSERSLPFALISSQATLVDQYASTVFSRRRPGSLKTETPPSPLRKLELLNSQRAGNTWA